MNYDKLNLSYITHLCWPGDVVLGFWSALLVKVSTSTSFQLIVINEYHI